MFEGSKEEYYRNEEQYTWRNIHDATALIQENGLLFSLHKIRVKITSTGGFRQKHVGEAMSKGLPRSAFNLSQYLWLTVGQ